MCGSDVLCQGEIVCELKSVTQWRLQAGAAHRIREGAHRYGESTFDPCLGEPMPLARIDLLEGKTPEYRSKVGLIVYQALLDCFSVPKDDLFQIITEHSKAELQFSRSYLGIQRSDDCIFIQIMLSAGRTVEMKQRFYKTVAEGLHEALMVRREDVFINLVEVVKENWSFGNGEAQYVTR
jgi:4-oxalocrotonate tautomerase